MIRVSVCGVCHAGFDKIEEFDLADAHRALPELETSRVRGATVLRFGQDRGR